MSGVVLPFQAVTAKPNGRGHNVLMIVTKSRSKAGAYQYSLNIAGQGCVQHQTINFDDIIRSGNAHFDRLTTPKDETPLIQLVKR